MSDTGAGSVLLQPFLPCKIGAGAAIRVSGFTTEARGHWEDQKQYPSDNDSCAEIGGKNGET